MKKVFSSVEMPETVLIRDALLHEGIGATIQNQHSGFAAIPPFRAPAEVWVDNDNDLERARTIVRQTVSRLDSTTEDASWTCERCKEQNPSSFDVCWSCDSVRSDASDR